MDQKLQIEKTGKLTIQIFIFYSIYSDARKAFLNIQHKEM